MTIKLAHLSDAHLGYHQYGLQARSDDFASTWLWTCHEIAERGCEFVVMAGDLFNHRNITVQAFFDAVAGLGLLKNHNIPVYAIEGNHEQMRDGSKSWLQALAWEGYLTLLEKGVVGYKDLIISGLPYSGAKTASKIEELRCFGKNHILLLHAAYEPAIRFSCREQVSRDLLEGLDVGYVAIGHIHKRFDDGKVHSTGSLETWSVDELNDPTRGFNVVTYEHGLYFIEPVVTPKRKWTFISVCLDGCLTATSALNKIREEVANYTSEEAIVTLTITGPDLGVSENDIRKAIKDLTLFHIRVELKTEKVKEVTDTVKRVELMVEHTNKPDDTWREVKALVKQNTLGELP